MFDIYINVTIVRGREMFDDPTRPRDYSDHSSCASP